jgi:hypothetical protein
LSSLCGWLLGRQISGDRSLSTLGVDIAQVMEICQTR